MQVLNFYFVIVVRRCKGKSVRRRKMREHRLLPLLMLFRDCASSHLNACRGGWEDAIQAAATAAGNICWAELIFYVKIDVFDKELSMLLPYSCFPRSMPPWISDRIGFIF